MWLEIGGQTDVGETRCRERVSQLIGSFPYQRSLDLTRQSARSEPSSLDHSKVASFEHAALLSNLPSPNLLSRPAFSRPARPVPRSIAGVPIAIRGPFGDRKFAAFPFCKPR